MKWKDINESHNGQFAVVTALLVPTHYSGQIVCLSPGALPKLFIGREVHNFADWFDVEIIG